MYFVRVLVVKIPPQMLKICTQNRCTWFGLAFIFTSFAYVWTRHEMLFYIPCSWWICMSSILSKRIRHITRFIQFCKNHLHGSRRRNVTAACWRVRGWKCKQTWPWCITHVLDDETVDMAITQHTCRKWHRNTSVMHDKQNKGSHFTN